MATYRKSEKNGKIKLTEITPEEAVEIIDKGAPYKVEEKEEVTDKAAKEAQLLGSTKEAIQLRMAEIKGELLLRKAELKGHIDTIKATESAKEKAGKHLAVFGAAYLCLCVLGFLISMSLMTPEAIGIAATLITLVVTQLASILKTVVDTKEPKDPVELMSDIVHKTLGGDEGKN
tara:strand:+ start:492 stop:1016 length:525 start_codon:yes stop_codon:yes gene_type:complete